MLEINRLKSRNIGSCGLSLMALGGKYLNLTKNKKCIIRNKKI